LPIYLVRHGETEWSQARRHTGRTDVPLTPEGRAQAANLAAALHDLRPQRVLSSPLGRALETCRLAGFGDQVELDERLVEWDYGFAEGRTTADIRAEQPGWSVWTHELVGGESLDAVGQRADRVLGDLGEPAQVSVLFAHAHFFRILGARWCGLPAVAGRHLVLDTASVSVLGHERETPCLERWNLTTDALS
jgi:probable phosphoglycerate mutase